MGQVQYPGVMSPGGLIDITPVAFPEGPGDLFYDDNYIDAAIGEWSFERWTEIAPEDVLSAPGGTTAFFYDDSFIDPVSEWSFEPWVEIPGIEIISAPGGPTAFFVDDSFIPPTEEWIFERWVLVVDTTPVMAPQFFTAVDMIEQAHDTVVPDIAGMDSQIIAILLDKGIYDYFDIPTQDDTAIQSEAIEPWTDIPAVVTIVDYGVYDYDTTQLPNPEIFPETDDLMMEAWATLEDAGVFLFTDTILEFDEVVPPVMEWSLEPWTDLTAVNLADAPYWAYEADPAQDDSTFLPEFSFEPWVDVNAANPADAPLWAYEADPAQDDSTFLPEFSFEPWRDISAADPADAGLWAYEADPAQDDSTFLPEFWFEPWSDVQTITTADVPKFDYDTAQIPGVEYDPNYTVWNTWGDEPWTDQPAPVTPPSALWIRCVIDTCNQIAVTMNPVTSLETFMTIAATQLTAREFDLGQLVCITAYFRDSNGTLTDPTNVYFAMRAKAVGVTTTLTYGVDADLVKDATGTYHVDIDTNESGGRWEWNFYSTGTGQAADHDYFQVKPTIAV
jgi:hypothetical protein